MLPGEINLNINSESTGLFFANNQNQTVKIGPAHVGATAPNSNPAGEVGHSLGEFWYDTSTSLLKIFNGTEFVAVESGEVKTVTGTGAISVDSSDAENPVISVASASTSTPGVVQLVDNTNSTSITEALTANQGKLLQDQINSLSLSSNITFGGTFNPYTGLMVNVTEQGGNQGFVAGQPIPAAAAGNSEIFLISEAYAAQYTAPGDIPLEYHVGDWLLSNGSSWQRLDVGHHALYATESSAGSVELSTDAETQEGISGTVAVTPSSLQSKVSDATELDSSTTLASSKAVKDATDARVAGDAALQLALDSEVSRATNAEGVLQGNIDAEETRALAAEGLLSSAISSETSRATSAESTLQGAIDAEVSRATGAEGDLQDAIDAEVARATAAEAAIVVDLSAEEARATAAEQANTILIQQEAGRAMAVEYDLTNRLDDIDHNLETPKTVLFENASSVIADGAAPLQDPDYRDGWFYTNEAGEKINWYFFDGNAVLGSTLLGFTTFYSVITLTASNSQGDAPFISVYSKPTGSGDGGSWYKSRWTFIVPAGLTVGKKYLFCAATNLNRPAADPQVHPELERVWLDVDPYSSTGPMDDTEPLLTTALSSNSGSAAGAVNFLAESVGYWNESRDAYHQYPLRFRKPTVSEIESSFDFGLY